MVEGLEGALRRDGEDERLVGHGVPDLDRRAVIERAPVERHLDPAADAACELAAGLNEQLAGLLFMIIVLLSQWGSVGAAFVQAAPWPASRREA